MLTLIAAIDEAGGIGLNGRLPWDLPEDRRMFRRMTMGEYVIMGRRTYESIGRPLEGRKNIVVTRSEIPGVLCVPSLGLAIKAIGNDEGFVIGGMDLYEEALPHCSYAMLTLVPGTFKVDTYFPVATFNKLPWDTLARWPGGAWVRQVSNPTMPFKIEVKRD